MLTTSSLAFRKAKPSLRSSAVRNILQVKRQLQEYWASLSEDSSCRDLTPGKPLFRFNIHLALTYYLVHIFIGRSLIINDTKLATDAEKYVPGWQEIRDELVNNCLQSAVSAIEMCQLLDDEIGLARSSYTEFTSCCSALIVILAERISAENLHLKDVCTKGIALLKKASVGIFSRNSEKLAVESLELAVHKLDSNNTEDTTEANEQGYMQFRNWVSLQQVTGGAASPRLWQRNELLLNAMGNEPLDFGTPVAQDVDFDMLSNCLSFSLGEFASVPGLDEWFEYGLH